MDRYGAQKAKAGLAEAAQVFFESSSKVQAAEDAQEANADSSTTAITLLPESRTPKSALTNPEKVDKSKSLYPHSVYFGYQLTIYQIPLCRRRCLGLQMVSFKHPSRELDRKIFSLDINATDTD